MNPSKFPRTNQDSASVNRRAFIQQIVTAGAVASTLALPSPAKADRDREGGDRSGDSRFDAAQRRRDEAFSVRYDAALREWRQPVPAHPGNGDEALYPNRIGNFTKGLPHNNLGEVDPSAYNALLKAVATGRRADFEAIPLGSGGAKLSNPQAGLAFDLEGPDSHALTMPPAPALASAQAGADLAEVYWMAHARDVHFSNWDSDSIIAAAASDLSHLTDFRAPKINGQVTPATIFRGNTPGDWVGPYLSQFLWLSIPQGSMWVPQKLYTTTPGLNYLTNYSDWLAVQNGFKPAPYNLDPAPCYIRNLRDLGEWAHVDALYQAYHQACLILLGLNAPHDQRNWYGGGGAPYDAGNPYWSSNNQSCFGTFCGPHVLSVVTEMATRALKACWFQKWFVSRRLRPEAMGGLVHQTRAGMVNRPLHTNIVNSAAVDYAFSKYGTFLLPVAMPEGNPMHPSYAAGHATVAGACVTILKAWFDESTVIPNPVIPNADGTALLPYSGPPLTVGNELNKLAANVAQGRNALGIHYRSDYWESLKLGEQLAIGILLDQAGTYNETGSWTLTKFDGTTISIQTT